MAGQEREEGQGAEGVTARRSCPCQQSAERRGTRVLDRLELDGGLVPQIQKQIQGRGVGHFVGILVGMDDVPVIMQRQFQQSSKNSSTIEWRTSMRGEIGLDGFLAQCLVPQWVQFFVSISGLKIPMISYVKG